MNKAFAMNTNRILRLDEITSSKIAAGEVVEKPAMVVKELVENAVDAGATEIIVDIKKGGKKLIRVVDNGSGIHRDDVDLMFERHATSKIRKIDDLYKTLSLGFRGEALASISAVANVEVITMQENDDYGIKIEASGGAIVDKSEMGAKRGTSIVVRDLFYNTPARLKFLKSDSVETKHISEIMGNLALSHPEIAFKYSTDDQMVFKTPGDEKLENTIFSIYDRTLIKHLFEIKDEFDFLKLKGYISTFDYTKGTRQQQIVFVNGRYVKSDVIKDAINLAYKPYLMHNRYPVCFLFLEIDPDKIDVNIHPAKTEIKFHDDGVLKQFIYTALKKAFNLQNQVPEVSLKPQVSRPLNFADQSNVQEPVVETTPQVESISVDKTNAQDKAPVQDQTTVQEAVTAQNRRVTEVPPITLKDSTVQERDKNLYRETVISEQLSSEKGQDSNPSRAFISKESTHEHAYQAPPKIDFSKVSLEPLIEFADEISFFDKPIEADSIYDDLKYIGTFINAYLLYEKDNQLYLIDQHAAHEKILYERFVTAYKKGKMISQGVLLPEIIELDHLGMHEFNEHQAYFNRLGYEVSIFGDKSVIIRAIPNMFNIETAKAILVEILEGLSHKMDDSVLEKLMSRACKAAVKAYDKLSNMEIESLLEQLKGLEEPYTCPHGRPIIISFSKSEIEKKFKRII